MHGSSFILEDINQYLIFISQVKNLSENTTKSYKRDLKKLSVFINELKVSNYSDITPEICSAWIGNLYNQDNNQKAFKDTYLQPKVSFVFLKRII